MQKYDTSKPVILVGPNANAIKIPTSTSYYIATINLALKLVDYTDFAVFNDANCIKEILDYGVDKVGQIITPEYPHSVQPGTYHPDPNIPYNVAYRELVASVDFGVFNIQTAPPLYNKSLPKWNVTSTGGSAIRYLAYLGFSKIGFTGIGTTGIRHRDSPAKHTGIDGKTLPEGTSEAADNRYQREYTKMLNFFEENSIEYKKIGNINILEKWIK